MLNKMCDCLFQNLIALPPAIAGGNYVGGRLANFKTLDCIASRFSWRQKKWKLKMALATAIMLVVFQIHIEHSKLGTLKYNYV